MSTVRTFKNTGRLIGAASLAPGFSAVALAQGAAFPGKPVRIQYCVAQG